MHLGWFHKLIFLVLLVSAEEKQLPLSQNESSMRSVSQNEGSGLAKAVTELKQRRQQEQKQEQQQQQSEAPAVHSLDQFFAGKRSVPNASDPLHNR
ncbi:hypothetical protein DCAR_0418318 [Daucus carota subsp. sativus]|uniref:Uncharacterized protein n=1 Tax=Daucus carota subsp. sativus TaxID=79200 RepID=A0A165ZBG3_DAUCS|nr:hypothetical protein DCAR_0418318 [Daucus carota subsp. sativus]